MQTNNGNGLPNTFRSPKPAPVKPEITAELPLTKKPSKSRKVALWFVAALIIVGIIIAVINQSGHQQESTVTPPLAQQEVVKPEPASKVESQPKPEPVVIPTTRKQPKVGEVMTNSIGMKLVYIPAGEFMMGSPSSESQRENNEGPQHSVRISRGFYMGIYEVTQAQYKAVMSNNPSNFKGNNLPVEQVSWNDVTEFCRKLSQKENKTYRLPTEAQWEYACRAGTSTPFYFGETISTDQANYDGNYIYGNGRKGTYRQKTTTVGSFGPNAFGLYDMHGNIWEWCQDWYDKNYYNNSSGVDPEGPNTGSARVLRGGSWSYSPGDCRSAIRGRSTPVNRYVNNGFRVVVLDFQ